MHRLILHNGVIQPSSARTASPGQTGLMNGWGVFSTLRVASGVLFAYERHWARMARDAKAMRVPMPPDPDAFREELLRLVEANEAYDATLRVCIVRNRGGNFEGEGIERDYDVVAFTTDLVKWGEGVRLTVREQGRHAASPFAGTKVLSWSHNLTFLEIARSQGFDEVILLNEHGNVSECTSANIVIETESAIVTPPLSSGCLPGITRELLLTDEVRGDTPVEVRDFRVEELLSARAVFISSSTRNLLPVLEVNGQRIRREERLAARLRASYGRCFDSYISERAALTAQL